MKMDKPVNVFGEPLVDCSHSPVTGFYRDGKCNTCSEDVGSHTVCIVACEAFLAFSKDRGNDLSTPAPEFGFKGIKPGESWCLCAARWLEAQKADKAPRVHLTKTHQRALEIIPLEILRQYNADLN